MLLNNLGEDELDCAFDPVGSTRKRIGRQNDRTELSNGDSDGKVSVSSDDSNHSYEERVSQTLATETPPILPTTDIVTSNTEPTVSMEESHSEHSPPMEPVAVKLTTHPEADSATETPAFVMASSESVISAPDDALDPVNDAENIGPNRKTDHRDNLLTTTSVSIDVSTNPSTTTTSTTASTTAATTTEKSTTTIPSTSTSKKPSTSTPTIPITSTSTTSTTTRASTTTIAATTPGTIPNNTPSFFECQEWVTN